MSVTDLLSRLQKVQKNGANSWMALCSGHDDRSRSLKVTQAEDGRTLIHCFAGCEPDNVLAAVGLSIDDLFDTPLYQRAKPIRGTKVYPREVLQALRTELMIMILSANDLRKGKNLSEIDRERLDLSYERFSNALELAEIE